jgi:hypothetical protein
MLASEPERAAREVDELLEEISWHELSAYNRNYPLVALTWAMIGDAERADSVLDEYEARIGGVGDPWGRDNAALARGLQATLRGEAGAGARLAEAAALHRCLRCADIVLGYGLERVGDAEGAIAAYERYVAHRFFDAGSFATHLFVPLALERLAKLQEDAGRPVEAVRWYRRLATVWSDADAARRPRADEARRRAEALELAG